MAAMVTPSSFMMVS